MGLVTVGKSCGVLRKQGQLEGVGSRGTAEQWCCGGCDRKPRAPGTFPGVAFLGSCERGHKVGIEGPMGS